MPTSPLFLIEHIVQGEVQAEVVANTATDSLESAIAGTDTFDAAGTGITILDQATDAVRMLTEFTGILTGAKTIQLPAVSNFYVFEDSTTGAFDLFVGVSGGVQLKLIRGFKTWVYCDGVDTFSMANVIGNHSRTVTTTANLELYDQILFGDSTAGNFTITLPATIPIGQRFLFVKIVAGNVVTLGRNGNTIDAVAADVTMSDDQDTVVLIGQSATNWTIQSGGGGGGAGDVVGPASAVDNRVAVFNGTTGKIIKDGGVLISGSNTGDQTLPIDSTITTTDNVSNNVSTSKHGWTPKLSNVVTEFLNGQGAWSVPAGGGGGGGGSPSPWIILETQTPASVASIDLESFAAGGYSQIRVNITGLSCSVNDSQFTCQYKLNAAYKTSANYRWTNDVTAGTGSTTIDESNADTKIELGPSTAAFGMGNAAGEGGMIQLIITDPDGTSLNKFMQTNQVHQADSATVVQSVGGGLYDGTDSTNALEGLRIAVDTGTFSGNVIVMGLDPTQTGTGATEEFAAKASVYPEFTEGANDDEFNDESFTGWTTVEHATPPTLVLTETNNRLSIVHPGGDITAEMHAFMKTVTPSTNDFIEIAFQGLGIEQNFNIAGLIMADGNTEGAGAQVAFYFSPNEANKWALARFTGYNTLSGAITADNPQQATPHSDVFMRLKYEGSNNWSGWCSPDGIGWVNLTGTLARTLTPTHIGFFVTSWTGADPFAWSFRYFKHSS